jgi:hypothetical protein
LNQRLKIETRGKLAKLLPWYLFKYGCWFTQAAREPSPHKENFAWRPSIFQNLRLLWIPTASCKTTEKHHTLKATFEPEPLKWNECIPCPSCSIIKYGDRLKYLFTVEMVGTSGAATMIFFKKTICHSTSLWKYNFNIGFFKI